jgi:hypothetical protein
MIGKDDGGCGAGNPVLPFLYYLPLFLQQIMV